MILLPLSVTCTNSSTLSLSLSLSLSMSLSHILAHKKEIFSKIEMGSIQKHDERFWELWHIVTVHGSNPDIKITAKLNTSC